MVQAYAGREPDMGSFVRWRAREAGSAGLGSFVHIGARRRGNPCCPGATSGMGSFVHEDDGSFVHRERTPRAPLRIGFVPRKLGSFRAENLRATIHVTHASASPCQTA